VNIRHVIVAIQGCTVWRCLDGQKVLTTSLVHPSPVHHQTTAGMPFSLMATGSWWTATGQHATCRQRETHQRALFMSMCNLCVSFLLPLSDSAAHWYKTTEYCSWSLPFVSNVTEECLNKIFLQLSRWLLEWIIALCAKLSGAVYSYRSCLFATGGHCVFVALWVCYTITRNCVHRSSPNLVCR